MIGKKYISLFIVSLLFSGVLFAQEKVQFNYNGGGNYTLIERTDLRRYDNGRYVGLVSREVRSFITRTAAPNNVKTKAKFFEGSFYVMEETKRASVDVSDGIHDSIPSSFRITSDGQLIMIEDHGYPSFRSFPAFTNESISIGDKWQAKAERSVDPLNKGVPTKIPMYVEYTYLGDESCRGEDVYVLKAQWATRYGISYFDWGGDSELKSANGKHTATMYISKNTGYAIVVRDSVDETFVYSDGNQISFKGTISLFTEYPPAVDRDSIIPALQRVASLTDEQIKDISKPLNNDYFKPYSNNNISEDDLLPVNTSEFLPGEPIAVKTESSPSVTSASSLMTQNPSSISSSVSQNDLTVENTEAGIRLTMQNLQFKADSYELLPGESKRLDEIASVLKQIPNCQFLVEGHTASTGREKGELLLSEQRAHEIAKELSKRGISSGRFICKGSGGKKPVADNSTAEGKARNRRVEITILE